MDATESKGGTRAVLYTRSELPPPAEEQSGLIYERLQDLVESNIVDAVDRSSWKKRTPVEDCESNLRDIYLSFSTWARETDRDITPFFGIRECYSPEHEERIDWLVMPALCLAVYDDGELTAVYPHTQGEVTKTVEDGVDELERRTYDQSDRQTAIAD